MTLPDDDDIEAQQRLRNGLLGSSVLTGQAVSYVVLARLLGNTSTTEVLGAWSLTSAILAWASLFDFGVGEIVAQRVAALQGRSAGREDVDRLVRAGQHELRRYALFAGLVLAPTLYVLAMLMTGNPTTQLRLALYWIVSSLAFLAGMPSTALSAVHLGRGEIWAQRVPLLAETAGTTLVTLLVMTRAVDPLVILTVAPIAGRAAGVGARRVIFRQVLGYLPAAHGDRVSLNRRVGRDFLLASLGTRILLASDTFVLGLSAGVTEVGGYAFVFRCAYTTLQVIWLLTDHAFAAVARMVESGNRTSIRHLLRHQLRQVGILGALAAAAFAVLARPLAARLSHALVVPESVALLTAGFIFVHSAVHVVAIAGQGLSEQRSVGRIVIVSAVINLLLSLTLVPFYGAAGLLYGTLLADLIISFPLLLRVCRRKLAD